MPPLASNWYLVTITWTEQVALQTDAAALADYALDWNGLDQNGNHSNYGRRHYRWRSW